jgi:hypothetical protein
MATITARTATTIADAINADFAAGRISTVNGRELVTAWGKAPAVSWQNGSVSVTVKGRTKGKVGTVFVKVGQELRTA